MTSQRVLVTGGAGFIGSHLVDKLVDEGCEVIVLDDLSTGLLGNIEAHVIEDRIEFVEGNVLDEKVVARVVRDVDAVVHLAAVVSVPYSVTHPEDTYEVNVSGTKVLLDACVASGVRRFVFASTCAVYGEANYTPIDEGHGIDPLSPYAESKLVAEQMLPKDYGEALDSTILRIFNVYGPKQSSNDYAGVITIFKEKLQEGKAFVVFGDGLQTRDFIHVNDITNAVWLVLSAKCEGVFNLCSGKAVTIKQLAEVMAELAGREDLETIFVKPREGDVRHSHGTYAKAKEGFGFEPSVTLRKGLDGILERDLKRKLVSAF